MLITATLFAAASLPTFLVLRERARPEPLASGASLTAGAFARLAATARQARRYRDLARFLACIVFYQAGIQTVVVIAAIYAQETLGFTTKETIAMILVVNITAAAGAFAFGHVQDRLGHVRTIAVTLVLWIATALVAWGGWRPDRDCSGRPPTWPGSRSAHPSRRVERSLRISHPRIGTPSSSGCGGSRSSCRRFSAR